MALIDVKQIDLSAVDKDITFSGAANTIVLDAAYTPSADNEVANKGYVDSVAQGLDVKESVRLATTQDLDANTSISGSPTYSATGGTSARGQITATLAVSDTFTVDGVSLGAAQDGTRILLKNEATGNFTETNEANGIWVTTISGTSLTLDRATDFDEDAEVTAGAFTFVEEGTANADQGFVLVTNDPITIGGASGTGLTFTQFSGAGSFTAGDGIDITGSTISVDLEAAGAGTGGLAFDAGELRVLANTTAGIELTASGVAVDLEAAGAGTGGLAFDSGEIRVNVEAAGAGTGGLELVAGGLAVLDGDGIEQTASGIAVDIEAAGAGTGGLAFDAGELRVLADTTSGIELTASGVAVDLEAAGAGTGGLAFDAGEIRVNVEAAGAGTGGLELVAGGLAVLDGDGIEQTASGIAVDIEAAGAGTGGLAFDAGELRVNIEAAGASAGGLELVAGGLAVLEGNGLTKTASGVEVLANGDSIDVSASGIKAAVPSPDDKNETPAAASSGQSTTVAIANTPAGDGYVAVMMNGIVYNVGDGVTTSDFYFRDSGNTVTRNIADIIATDVLYVGSGLGFSVETSDRISLLYNEII